MNERSAASLPGIPTILVFLVAIVLVAGWVFGQVAHAGNPAATGAFVLIPLFAFLAKGFFQVQPNQGQVMQLFGKYAGTERREGLRWTNPFYSRRPVSLRVRNFESGRLKVNDNDGNPIEIAAIVVWQVVDTAEAVFCVDDYENFVQIQSESALRQMAQSYAYDAHDDAKASLRSHGEEVNNHLRQEIEARLNKAGVQVIESRISHLAYAQEIAQAMLQRQQAGAIVAARERIVEGAVGMVALALDQLRAQGVVELDEERKAAMVSNLLVVLCGDRATQPVVNAGSLYN
ncbi:MULTISPECIES: SPFH domain-containing protein [unclassified Luteibacter]|uniref:SPFH domain-containing protein n=1 Tax=unclassified Luteibacter TaxID=2620188 RepID=UPI0008B399BB|nr:MULTISPECIES: SPFH domain-containing protein [unclassified Luteibacter]MDR6934846.1 regulator of protease activity HflC (stomatin/prohibitin superfamily) [Luteibacter sp. 3190]SEO85253.1 Regulator of protease activity HflC, stomatin/prohibitin superfamily [Luteibacter sp. UNC138MFCol5.1]SEW02195.1 Regulator of protease activity HflC, stomatin/prohibitin superfamily [Luteibacter sp. 329MFSha]